MNAELDLVGERLENIKKLCSQILQKILPIMKTLLNSDNIYVDDVMDSLPSNSNIDENDVLEVLRTLTCKMVSDAETLNGELDKFTSYLLKDELDRLPFLQHVWCGDTYDEDGLQGLKELEQDLAEQLECLSDDFIIKKALEIIKS